MRLQASGAALLLGLAGCAPALDWRDVRPANSSATLQFPCRPAVQERNVPLAGTTVRLVLHACSAADLTWGLGFADVGDPMRVGPALAALRAAAAANVKGAVTAEQPLQVPGATPRAESLRLRLAGQRPDGRTLQMHLALFAFGTRVYQASVLGAAVDPEAAENFFASIRIAP